MRFKHEIVFERKIAENLLCSHPVRVFDVMIKRFVLFHDLVMRIQFRHL